MQQFSSKQIISRILIQIGQNQYPIQQIILGLILIISLIIAILFFSRGHGTYSIKYQLMRKSQYFRRNQSITMSIQYLYKLFFTLPFICLLGIVILRIIKQQYNDMLSILINGIIVIVIIYPGYRQSSYIKNLSIWIFAVISQFFTLFLYDPDPYNKSSFVYISVIFYTLNSMIFAIALLFNQKQYWEIGQAIELVGPKAIEEINKDWIKNQQQNLPIIFTGGLYGWIAKNQHKFKYFIILYFISLIILGVYAYLIYLYENSFLGITGLITSIIYDIFIFTFSSLRSKQRSLINIYLMIYMGRLLTFIFGKQYYLFGHCILYFFIGIFIGSLIIDKQWPLKIKKQINKFKKINAFKTPQFVLIILTIEIIVLILIQQLHLIKQQNVSVDQRQQPNINLNSSQSSIQVRRTIPIWQFSIIIVLITWIIIMYMASIRIMNRHINKIRTLVQYYFGFMQISQYHIYILMTYILILAVGFYSLFYLESLNIFLGCLFLPIVYTLVFEIGIAWIKNQYAIIADTDQFNQRQLKKFNIKQTKYRLLQEKQKQKKQMKIKKIKQNQQNYNHYNDTNHFGHNTINLFNKKTKSILQSNKMVLTSQMKMNKKSNKQKEIKSKSKKKKNNKQQQFLHQTSEHKFQTIQQSNIQNDSAKGSNKQLIGMSRYKRQKQNNQQQLQIYGFNDDNDQYNYNSNNNNGQKQDDNNNNRKQLYRIEQFKQLINWRQQYNNLSIKQIWENLTKYDKTILSSLFILLLIFISYSLVSIFWAESISGIAFTVSIISFLTSFFYYKLAKCGQSQSLFTQMIISISGFIIGVVFWVFYNKLTIAAILYSLVQIILYMMNLNSGIKKQIETKVIILLGVKITLLCTFICVLAGINYHVVLSIVLAAIIIVIGLGCLNFTIFKKKGHVPKRIYIPSILFIIGIILAFAIIGFQLQYISDVIVFTIILAFLIVGFLIVSGLLMLTKHQNRYLSPHVHSCYGTQVYKFDSQKQRLILSGSYLIIFQISMILLVVYSTGITILFKQKYYSIYALSIFMIIKFTQLILRSIETYYHLGEKKKYITKDMLMTTLDLIKNKYMPGEIEGEDSNYYIQKFKEKKKQALQAEQQQLDKKWLETTNFKYQLVKNLQEQQKVLYFWLALIKFTLYAQRRKRMIQYIKIMQQLKDDLNQYGIIIQSLQLADTIQIKYQKVKKQINSLQPMDYLIVEENYQKLFIEHMRDKKKLKQLHEQHQKQHKKKQQQAFKNYNKDKEDGQNNLKSMINSHNNNFINSNISNNILNNQKIQKIDISNNNKISDSNNNKNPTINSNIRQTKILQPTTNRTQSKIQEFKRKVQELQKNNQLFQDNQQFPHNEQSLGQLLKQNQNIYSWRRPKSNQNFIMGAGMSPDDVKQGQIGDCYLISSFAVLGNKYLHKCIGIQEKNNQKIQQWKNKNGAYMVRFYKFLMPVYIIVDDYMPINAKEQWIFARSQQKDQFWPGIIQKAYAKLYKNYSNIVSGKCHQVLAQFTGGFPFQIILSEYTSNPAALWLKLMNSKQKGYLFAAGSLQHDLGDKAFSKRGIVYGHAYSILDVRQVQQYKLIQLKNPHGSAGRQWTGDFSDNSPYMKPRIKTLLKHQKKNDGIFWMKLQDFMLQFKSLYICCIFEEGWKNFGKIIGEWINDEDKHKRTQNSFGRIQKAQNPQFNYQFGITVHRNCTLFISLTQQNATSLEGKNNISFRVQKNNGKRIHKADNQSEGECSAPMKLTNAVTVSQEVLLSGTSFPYTFTIYLACQKKDYKNKDKIAGQGYFMLQMFCDDLEAEFIPHEQFDVISRH